MTEHSPKALQKRIEEVAGFELELAFRPMFGGIFGYANGRPFASLSNRGLALKLGDKEMAELRDLPGARPLRYEHDDPPSKTYTLVPDQMLKKDDALLPWLEKSVAFVTKAARPKSRAS